MTGPTESSAPTTSAFAGLDEYLEREVLRVERALSRAVDGFEADALLDVAALAAIRHGVTSGGKRLRPILCVAAFRACQDRASCLETAADEAEADETAASGSEADDTAADGADETALYDLAVSLELIHAYSLMHDDLPCMDDAELRRGRPTTHREHGEAVTVTAAAALIPLAARHALEACRRLGLPEDRSRRVARSLMSAAGAGGMVGGQWLDLLGEGEALGAEALGDLHRRKTGALLAAALVMGAEAAQGSEDEVEALATYGGAVGLAFQIADDILDATATAEALGKNPSDTELNKSTYVALYGLTRARARAQQEVDRALEALATAHLTSEPLEALARYVVERRR